MVNSINNQIPLNQETVNQQNTSGVKTLKKNDDTGSFATMDTITISNKSESTITYTSAAYSNSAHTSSISSEEMKGEQYELLRQLVTNMLKEQGIDFKIATGTSEIDISEISQEEAQELIAEDGYFGVEQTSDRIVDLAIATAGGDVSKLDVIKQGVEKGFNEALEAFGGWLPDISYNTFDAVMEKLDHWADPTIGQKT